MLGQPAAVGQGRTITGQQTDYIKDERQSVESRHRYLIAVLGFAIAIGFVAGGLVMYAAWQHNPQCEFHCDGVIHWETWLLHGAMYWLAGFIGAIPIAAMGALAVRLLVKRAQ